MVYIGKNSNNEYYYVPNYVVKYLECFKIIPCSKYPFNDPNVGEAGMVEFYYDNNKRTGLNYEVSKTDWVLKNVNEAVATFNNKVINIDGYCISSSSDKADRFSIRMDSNYSGISSEVSVTIINGKKIDITFNCAGLGGEYNKSTTISRDAQFFHPEEYFDRMLESIDSEKYWRCSDKQITDSDIEAMQEMRVLDRFINDERLTETLVEKMRSMVKWEYGITTKKIRAGKSDKKPISINSYEKERMVFESSGEGDIIYNTHRQRKCS